VGCASACNRATSDTDRQPTRFVAFLAKAPLDFLQQPLDDTMYRCASALSVAMLALSFCLPTAAQVQRNFPSNALRGELIVGEIPQVSVNGTPGALAPGARIRGQNNMLQMSGSLVGAKLLVHYTLDTAGQVRDVWILTTEEAAKRPWPRTQLELDKWEFDFAAQTWSKP
jgi:hypothetical protein